jgi:hypothetical protein
MDHMSKYMQCNGGVESRVTVTNSIASRQDCSAWDSASNQ